MKPILSIADLNLNNPPDGAEMPSPDAALLAVEDIVQWAEAEMNWVEDSLAFLAAQDSEATGAEARGIKHYEKARREIEKHWPTGRADVLFGKIDRETVLQSAEQNLSGGFIQSVSPADLENENLAISLPAKINQAVYEIVNARRRIARARTWQKKATAYREQVQNYLDGMQIKLAKLGGDSPIARRLLRDDLRQRVGATVQTVL